MAGEVRQEEDVGGVLEELGEIWLFDVVKEGVEAVDLSLESLHFALAAFCLMEPCKEVQRLEVDLFSSLLHLFLAGSCAK